MTDSINLLDPQAIHSISHLALRARMAVLGSRAGIHMSRKHGSSPEFAEYRQYSPGDDIRRFDWKVYARTDKYHIKKFHDETNLRGFFLMDFSGSMGYSPWGGADRPSKARYGSVLAAALAYLLIDQQDAVGLSVMSGKSECFLPPRSTVSHLQQTITALGRMETGGESPLDEYLMEANEKTPPRGLVFLFTDLFCDLDRALTAIRQIKRRNHDMALFHVLDDDELEFPFSDLMEFQDMERPRRVLADPNAMKEEYRKEARDFCGRVREQCRVAGVDYVPARTGEPLEEPLKRLFRMRLET